MMNDRTVYEQIPALLQVVDQNGRIQAVSDRWLTWLGYEREAVIGRPWQSFLSAPSEASAIAVPRPDIPLQFQTRTGLVRTVDVSIQSVQDATGKTTHSLAVFTDITDPQQNQQKQDQSQACLEQREHDFCKDQAAPPVSRNVGRRSAPAVEPSMNPAWSYQASFDAAPIGMVHLNLDRQLQQVNRWFCKMSGYSAAELKQVSIEAITHPEDRDQHRDAYTRLLTGEIDCFTLDKRYLRKDGSYFWASTTVSTVRNEDCQPLFLTAALVDISDRKAAQLAQAELERRLQLIAETVSDIFWIDDACTRLPIYSSPNFEKVWGISEAAISEGLEVLSAIVHPEDREAFNQHLANNFVTTEPTELEFRIQRPPGQVTWLSQRCFPVLDDHGRPYQVVGVTTDITARKETEIALQQSERRLQLIAQTVDDFYWIDSITDQRSLYNSPNLQAVWGVSNKALQKSLKALFEVVHADDLAAFQEFVALRSHLAQPAELEFRILHPTKGLRWLRSRVYPLFEGKAQAASVVGVTADITASKQAEETLRQYERLFAANPDPVCIVDRNYTYRLANPAFQAWANCDTDLRGKPVAELVGEPFFNEVSKVRIEQALAGETQYFEEWAYNPNQPQPQFISITYTPYYEADGTISGVINSVRDLTALKQTRDRLALTIERLQLHIQNSPLAVIEWDSQQRVQNWSAQAETIFGWSATEVMGRHFSEFPLFSADCLDDVQAHVNNLLQSANHHHTVLTHNLNRQGEQIYCEWYNSALVDESGNLISILSLVQDVTHRQQTQIALRESEERWQLALLGSNDGIWDWKIPTNETFYSPRWKALLGFAANELADTYETWRDRIHPDDVEQVVAQMSAHLAGHSRNYKVEYRMRHKSGDYVWILSRGRAVFDDRGQPIRFVGSNTDISDRKEAELELRSSQQFLQLVFDNLPQRIFWKDLDGRFLGCNQAFAADMGYDAPTDLIGQVDDDLKALTPESLQIFQARDQQVLSQGQAITFEEVAQCYQDGSIRWVSTTKLPLQTDEGEILGIFATYQDVTERVLARESLKRYARMIETVKDGICLVDTDYRYQIINSTYREWYGYNDQPILGQTIVEVLGQAAFDLRLKPLLERCLNGETIRYANWFDFPHVGRRFRSVTLTPYVEDAGQIAGIVASIRDLTALKESETLQQQLLEIIEATPDFVGIASPQGQVLYTNPALNTLVAPKRIGPKAPDNICHYHPQWAFEKVMHEAIPAAMYRGTWQGETAILAHDGTEIPVSQTVTAHLDEHGEVKLVSMIARDIRPQKTLEQELRDRLAFEQLLSQISKEFVNLPSSQLSEGIDQALGNIAETLGAERGYVYLFTDDQQSSRCLSEWHAAHLAPIPKEWLSVSAEPFRWWIPQLVQRQVIMIDDIAQMPPDAANERQAAEVVGARSLAVVPMYHSGVLIGFVGFSSTQPKPWSNNEITLIRLVGDLFANAYQRQQVETALRRQEHYFRSLTEQASDVVMLLDAAGRFQYLTPSVFRLLGYSPEELLGQSAVDLVAAADVERVLQTLQNAAEQPGISQAILQYRIRHQNQQWRYFEAIATSLLHDPLIGGIVINCRDVSDRVLAETAQRRSEQVFKAIFEQSAISMAQISLDGTYLQVNPAFCQLVGYEAEDLIGEHYAKVTHPEDLAFDTALSNEVAEGKVPAQFIDKRFLCADGSVRHVQVVVTAVQGEQDAPAFLASVYNDVTEQVIAEKSLRSIVEGTAAVIGEDFFPVLARQLADCLEVDHVFINQLETGEKLSTIVFWSQNKVQPPFTYEVADTPCGRTLEQGFYCCPGKVQAQFPRDSDLARLNAESYLGVALKGQNGHLLGEICVVHSAPIRHLDNAVTLLRIFAARASAELERQKSNQALKTNEMNWRHILDSMPVLLNAIADDGLVTLWNKECERVTGYSAEEIIGNPEAFSLLYPGDDYGSLKSAWGAQGNNYRDWEWKITCKDGSQRIIAWSNLSGLFPIPDLGSWEVGVDVTERRQAEDDLRRSEARFQRLAANMPGVIYRYHQHPDGRDYFSYVSPGSRTLWELEPEAVYADAAAVWGVVHPDDVEGFKQSIEAAIAQEMRWFHEHRIITPSGQLKWIQGVAKAERQSDGSYAWDGVLIDVTARQEAETALQASEARFQRLAANMPGIIYRYHLDNHGRDHISYLSPACREIWEIEPEAVLQNSSLIWELVHPDDRSRLRAALVDSQLHLTPLFEDYRIVTPSGVLKWLKILARPVREPDGGCLWDGIVIDITEQRATQEALQASEALNRAILQALPDLLIRLRRDGLCLDMQYPNSFNVVCPRDRHIGSFVQDTLSAAVAQERIQATERALTTGKTQVYEYELAVNGRNRWEEARVVPLTDNEVLVLVRDIDDRKRTEQALRESEALNRAIVEALPDMIIRMTQDGICLNVQHPDSFPAIATRENAMGRNIRSFLPPDLVARRLANAQRALATQQTQLCEYQVTWGEKTRWEESRVVPLADDEVLILVRDIDERRRAEDEVRRLNQVLESQNQRLEELVELRTAELMTFMNSLPDQIFVVDRDSNVMTFGNQVVIEFAQGNHRQNYEGKSVFECFRPERAAYYEAQNRQVFETGEVLHVEEAIETAAGLVYLDTYKIPLKRPNGEVYALIGTSRDITELVKARQTLEAQAHQLEATNQELQSFSYSVSHDLRAPLRHINGFIAALKQQLETPATAPDTKVAHYIDVIEKSSHKMGLLIDGLLTLSRVGRREMAYRPVPLGPLVEQAIALIEDDDPENAGDRLHFTVESLPTVPGDPTLLQQVFTNLVSNAVKFSGSRTLARIHIGQRAEDGAIFIQDNGVGFDMAYADKLFSPFQRLHKPEEFQGTGIGLAIVNRIIRRHGGQIWVESTLDQGTTFFFLLPAAATPLEPSN